MSDSKIVVETPDTSETEFDYTNLQSSYLDVVESSFTTLDTYARESNHASQNKTINDQSASTNTSAMDYSGVRTASESMHMSVDKSCLQDSYRNMSIVDPSRSPSPEANEILCISSDEDDLQNYFIEKESQQVRLRPSILSTEKLRTDSILQNLVGSIKHSTPIKQAVMSTNVKTCSSDTRNLKEDVQTLLPVVKPMSKVGVQQTLTTHHNFKQIFPEISPKIDVTQSQFQQQKETIQKLSFDIIRAQNMLRSDAVNILPDKGVLLKAKLATLLKEKQEGEQLLKNMKVIEGAKTLKPIAWENLEMGLTDVQPRTFGKKAMQTLKVQKSLTLDTLKDIHGSLNTCPDENTIANDPKGLKVELMQHQKHALAWLLWREKQKPPGGILADDMGLGKTLTMISLILHCNQNADENVEPKKEDKVRRGYSGQTLVVCPASLVFQWEAEVKKHVRNGLLSVVVHHGTHREESSKRLAKQDIVITSYGLVTSENNKEGPLFGVKWKRIILDEAHQIRNYKTGRSVAVCELQGKYRWVLTGTPVHNTELDLYALLKFLRCAPFDELAVWKRWVANKAAGGQDRLNTVLSSIILRRTKQQLAEKKQLTCLPEKQWKLIEIDLDSKEMEVYQKILVFSRTLFAQFLHQRAEKIETQNVHSDETEYFKLHAKLVKLNKQIKPIKQHDILVLLLRLRQICCHPSLITGMLNRDENAGDLDEEESEEMNILEQLNNMTIHEAEPQENVAEGLAQADDRIGLSEAAKNVLNPSHPIFAKNRKSSKIKEVLKITEDVLSRNEKVIIISQWVKSLHLTSIHLKQKGIKFYLFDGSVPAPKRMEMVQNFNNSANSTKVLLLSLTAGGVGLNLVGANNLLLTDLHWNPQLEIQAQDRVYRLGQTKPVTIYKLITNGTIEQRIKQLQEKKMVLAEEILTGTKIENQTKLTLDDLKMLFSM